MEKKPLSFYLHIPFCSAKCDYCDFVSFPLHNIKRETVDQYFSALYQELELRIRALPEDYFLHTLYIGGGTPSTVNPDYYQPVVKRLQQRFNAPVEFTCEVNPKSVDAPFLEVMKDLGCNRISIGVQSPRDETLARVNRSQTLGLFLLKYDLIRKVYDNVNVDFICGLPENLHDWAKGTLDLIQKAAPEHVSLYLLESEKETPLGVKERQGFIDLPSQSYSESFVESMSMSLPTMGFNQYEISNYARPGYASLHNLVYWKGFDYIGLGVSAGGYFHHKRYVNTADLIQYLNSLERHNTIEEAYSQENTGKEDLKERLFMGLRLREGIDLAQLKRVVSETASLERIRFILSHSPYFFTAESSRLRFKSEYFIKNREAFEFLFEVFDIAGL